MPFTTVAWGKSVDAAGADANLSGVPDDHVTVSGNDIQVPSLNNLIGYAGIVDSTSFANVRLSSPSLLERGFAEYISPPNFGLKPEDPAKFVDKGMNPIVLDALEALQAIVNNNPASAVENYVVANLADGPVKPVQGKIETIRCTAAISAAANTWVNGALTLPVSLRAGSYQIVGARVVSANGVAFRFRFQGSPWRPGGLCIPAEDNLEDMHQRFGNWGVWGEFPHTAVPTLDVLGVTDTSQVVYLDLIQTK